MKFSKKKHKDHNDDTVPDLCVYFPPNKDRKIVMAKDLPLRRTGKRWEDLPESKIPPRFLPS